MRYFVICESMTNDPGSPGRGSTFAASARHLACAAAVVFFALAGGVQAQVTRDLQDTVYATGAVFETAEELADKPRTPLYRAFLPELVDLSGRFPAARHQGKQGSCVGWAVGYAARSYYNSRPEGGPQLTSDRFPARLTSTTPFGALGLPATGARRSPTPWIFFSMGVAWPTPNTRTRIPVR